MAEDRKTSHVHRLAGLILKCGQSTKINLQFQCNPHQNFKVIFLETKKKILNFIRK